MTAVWTAPRAGFLFGVAKDAYARIPSDQPARALVGTDPLVCIVSSAASLEGLINDFGQLAKSPLGWSREEKVLAAKLRRRGADEQQLVIAKFELVHSVLSGEQPDRGGSLWQNFQLLVGARNALMHLKPAIVTGHELMTVPDLITALAARRILAEFFKPHTALDLVPLLWSREVAHWACQTAIDMAQSLFDSTKPLTGLESHARDYRPVSSL